MSSKSPLQDRREAVFFSPMDLRLLPADVRTPTWRRMEAGLQEELQRLREANDSVLLDELRTRDIRARIAQIKETLSLAAALAASDSGNGPLATFADSDEVTVPIGALTG